MFEINKLKSELSCLSKGDKCVYFVGHIADENNPYRALCNQLSLFAYELQNAGRVHLFQRKLDDGIYEYIAIGR